MVMKSINEKPKRVEIDLTGPDGNAFSLIGYAIRWNTQLGKTEEEIKAFGEEMMSGDYEHLVSMMEERFGEFVTFYC
jgi:hypothetical protein